MEEKRIKHYSSSHKILLVGEGDFSFALSLAKAFGSASNIVATSLDSKDLVKLSYIRAPRNLKKLKKLGCTIVHGVDAHTMNCHYLLHNELFDRIVFNFPHAGFRRKETKPSQIRDHQNVVRGFLNSARKMVSQDGEIHITHKKKPPYCNWEILELAKEAELLLVEEVPFYIKDYPGYINKRGDGFKCDQRFHIGECSTFKFSNPHQPRIFGRIESESFGRQLDEVLAEIQNLKNLRTLRFDDDVPDEFRQSIEPKQGVQFGVAEHVPVEQFCYKRGRANKSYCNSLHYHDALDHNFGGEDYNIDAFMESESKDRVPMRLQHSTPLEIKSETETEIKDNWFWATTSLFFVIIVILTFLL